MTDKELQICKKNIIKCLIENFNGNRALFDKEEGWSMFNAICSEMVIEKVVMGLELSQNSLSNNDYEAAYKVYCEYDQSHPNHHFDEWLLNHLDKKHIASYDRKN